MNANHLRSDIGRDHVKECTYFVGKRTLEHERPTEITFTIPQTAQGEDDRSIEDLAEEFQHLMNGSLEFEAMELATYIAANVDDKAIIIEFQYCFQLCRA